MSRQPTIILLATNHEIQEKDFEDSGEFLRVLEYVLRTWGVQAILEEWTSQKGATVGQKLAQERNLKWINVGTPSTPEFETAGALYDCIEIPPIVLNRYGPPQVQVKREAHMLAGIRQAMNGIDVALMILGMAHLHSMTEKLGAAGFGVESFHWTRPPLTIAL